MCVYVMLGWDGFLEVGFDHGVPTWQNRSKWCSLLLVSAPASFWPGNKDESLLGAEANKLLSASCRLVLEGLEANNRQLG